MMTSLRSKWAASKARGGRISKLICNRRATQPPAHFQRNPPGRVQLAVFPRCSLLTYRSRYARRSRLEKQPTDLRRCHHYMRDGTLACLDSRRPRMLWAPAASFAPQETKMARIFLQICLRTGFNPCKPVLMPAIPVSMPSAICQIRPISRV
jgi:hypothetical protein